MNLRDIIPAGTFLDVAADLSFEIDGSSATLTGSGQHLTMTLAQPSATLHSLRGSAPSSVLGAVADGLAAAGLRLDVDTTRGRVMSLGDGVRSPIGRSFGGSTAMSFGPALGALGLEFVRDEIGRRLAAVPTRNRLAGAGAVLALALGIMFRRRGRAPA